jgi:GntR family transcriptional regulator
MLLATDSHSPKYAQIADAIRQRLARGLWPKRHQLPTNEELAHEFVVSRVTVRQAVDLRLATV